MAATSTRPASVAGPSQFEQLALPKRRRFGWVFAGVGLVVGSMLLGVLLFTLMSTTQPRLALRDDIPAGHEITAADLVVVDVNRASDVAAMTPDEQEQIIGKVATGPLPGGLLITPELFADEDLNVGSGNIAITVPLDSGAVPFELQPGRRVAIFETDEDGAELIGEARVSQLDPEGSLNDRRVELVVDNNLSSRVVEAAADGQVWLAAL